MEVEELAGQLEPVVDRHGLAVVLDALAYVCEAKSEHIGSAWQDRALARSWKKVGISLGRIAAAAAKERL